MPSAPTVRAIVVMGVEGSGKSTVGRTLAARLGYAFVDADDLHSPENRAKMAAGRPLDDGDRLPWLRAVAEHVVALALEHAGVVTACSALKRSYRDLLRSYDPSMFFIFLDGPKAVIAARVAARRHDFMPAALLDSQFDALEPLAPDERGVRVDVTLRPEEIVDEAAHALDERT